jgi:hypothetical protein
MGWSGKSNGELPDLLAQNGFDVLLTADKNIRFQQALHKSRVTVILLLAQDNRLHTLKPLLPKVVERLNRAKLESFYEVGFKAATFD